MVRGQRHNPSWRRRCVNEANSEDEGVDDGARDDFIQADSDAATVSGVAGDDKIDRSIGDDGLSGGGGDNLICCGAVDNTFVYSVRDRSDTITDFNAGNSWAWVTGTVLYASSDLPRLRRFAARSAESCEVICNFAARFRL